MAGLFRSDTSGGSISLNASIFANKGPKGLAGTDCAGARGSLASPRPYCVYPHGWCARPVRLSRGTQPLVRRARSVFFDSTICSEACSWSERSSVHRTVCMMLRWPRKCRCAGSFGVRSLDRYGRSTNFTVNGPGARGARAGGRPSFCRHSGGQGGINRLNESLVLRQQDELCHS